MRDYSAFARNPQIHHVSNSGTGSGTSLDSPKVANGRQKFLFFNSHGTQMSVMPCGRSGGHPEFNKREESGAVCDSSTAEHKDRGSGAQIGRKAGAQ